MIHRFLNGSDFLDAKNHTMIYYNHSHLSASYSIASTTMNCAIEIQPHSHDLVKNLRHYNKEEQIENRYVVTNYKFCTKLFEMTPC